MMNFYNYLDLSSRALFRKGIGNSDGSPPDSGSKVTKTSWLVMLLMLMSLTIGQKSFAQSTANYVFSTNGTGSLALDLNGNAIDLSTGATSLVGTGVDSGASAVTSIGFNFAFMGNGYAQFSASSNGILQLGSTAVSSTTTAATSGTVAAPKIAALGSDAITASAADGGGVVSKVVGTAPNRCLVVQWTSYSYWGNSAAPARWQVRLYETTGVVQFAYGNMPVGATASSYSIGFSVGTAANTLLGVTASTNTVSTTAITSNSFTAGTNMTNLHSTADGSRRLYNFSPAATTISAPTTLTFTNVSGGTATANWVDNSTNETSFFVTRATDAAFTQNVVGATVASTSSAATGGAYTLAQTGLLANVTYYYKVQAVANASFSSELSSSVVTTPVTYTATALGGLWNNAATWVGGIIPLGGNDVTIPAGSIVTVDTTVTNNNLVVNGTVQWNGTANAMTLNGNLTVNSGGNFLAYTSGGSGVTVNIAGNFQNDGFANFAVSGAVLVFNGATGSTLSGTGTFQGDGTNGIIRALFFNSLGSGTVSTSQNLVTGNLAHTAGSLNTNGKIIVDNTAQVYGLALNNQVASVAVTTVGAGYSVNPVVFGAAVTQWTSITGVLNTLYVSGSNVYRCTAAASIGATAPTHTAGTTDNLLWIGTTGTIGNPFLGAQAAVQGTQYFLGGNLYTCVVGGTPAAGYFPQHLSGVVTSGTASFLYVGSPATVTTNFDATTGSVRSLNLTNAGSGYSQTAPSIVFSVGVAGGTVTTAASASAVFFQQIAGPANSQIQKSGIATFTGGLTINSDQGASVLSAGHPQSSAGVGAVSTTNGGINYTVAPLVGFAGPTALNLITAVGSGYTTAPTVTVTGGTLVSGTALATGNFTITVNNGTVESVYLNGSTTACYSVPPTLTLTGGGGTGATLAFPTGCWPAATATLGANRQIANFTVTNAGFGYVTAPTVGIGATSATTEGGTFTLVATTPTARLGLYNLVLNVFLPASNATAAVSADDASIPSTRKINTLSLNGGVGLTLSSNLTLYGSSPYSATATSLGSGNIFDLGGNNVNFTWNGYAGAFSTFGSTNTYMKNGSMSLTGRGGGSSGSTFNFPFAGTFTWFSGSGTNITAGTDITRVTVSDTAAPSNTTLGTANAVGTRAFRVQTNGTAGTNPTVTLNFNSVDALTAYTQDQLLIADGTSLTGPWTVRSASSGTGAITAATTGSRTTATVAPGPIVPTTDSYYAWSYSVPTITACSPTTICSNAGTFTITGTNLTGVTNLQMGGVPVTSFTIVNATTITGVAGNASTGVVSVVKNGNTYSGLETINVTASPAAPGISGSSSLTVNLNGSATFTATGDAGAVFNWYTTANGGTPIFTGDTYTANYCATSTIYVGQYNGSCEGVRTPVTVTVNPTVITASVPRFCGTGGASTLTVTPSDSSISYAWTSITGAPLDTTTGEVVSTTVATSSDFSVTATSGTCTATASYSVSVYPLPSATVTTTASGVCPGTSATIGSGLSAGNFTVSSTAYKPYTIPASAVTVINNTTATTSLSGGGLDDGGWSGIPIGFNFNFFGTSFSSIAAGTNGLLMFGPVPGYGTGAGQLGQYSFNTTGGVFPNANNPGNVIALMAGDQTFSGAGKLVYWNEGIAPNRKFILLYEGVPNCCSSTNPKFTAYVTLYETLGTVDVSILSKLNTNACTVGLQDSTKTIGAVATGRQNFSTTITTPEAWRFTPPSNYTTVWTKSDSSGTSTLASGTNIFSQTVAPLETTTYSISYTNQTTTCTNAPGSAQVVMNIINTTAAAALATTSATSLCFGASANLGITDALGAAYVNNIGTTDGLTYQWQVSTDSGATWADIAGATNATATVTPAVASQYRCNIKSCTQVVPTTSSVVSVGFTNAVDTVTNATRCGSGSATVSATTSTVGASLVWYAAATGGTALATGASYTANVTQVGTAATVYTYYVAAETTGPACSSPRTPVTITVTPADVFTIEGGNTTPAVCVGGSGVTLTSIDANFFYDTFTVSPTTGATLTNDGTTLTLVLNPTTTTTYTLLGTQSFGANCGYSIPITVTVNPLPALTSVTASPAAVCLGNASTVTANLPLSGYTFAATTGAALDPMTGATTVLGASDDDTPTAASAPIGFNFSFNGVTYSDYSVSPDGWILLGTGVASNQYTNDVVSTTNVPKLYPYWDDLATGADGDVKTLVTGTAGNRIFKVQWHVTVPRALSGSADSTFQAWLYEATGKIEYRYGAMGAQSFGSASAGYTVNATNYSSITFDTNSASTTTPNNSNAGTPAVGTMYTLAPVIPGTVTWAPTTGLYTDAAATTPYTGGTAVTVYAKPTATTVYYATATTAAGCSVTDAGVTVTVNTDPVAEVTGGATSICLAGTTPDNDLQTPETIDFDTTTTGVTWSSSNTAVATIDANGVLTPLTAGTTNIRAFIYNPGTGCTTYSPNTIAVNVYAPIKITVNPTDQSALSPNPATTFTAAATGSGLTYQWQASYSSNTGFEDIINGGNYAGVTTPVLTVTGLELTTFFRCVVSGTSPCTSPKTTSAAKFTIGTITVGNPTNQSICENNGSATTGTATFSVTTTGNTPDGFGWEVNDGSGFQFIDGPNSPSIGGLTFTGWDTTSLLVEGITAAQSGLKFRATAAYSPNNEEVTSDFATLTVNTKAVITNAPTTNSLCYTGGTTSFTVNATGATSYQWKYFNGTSWVNVANNAPVGVSYSGATTATLNISTSDSVIPNDYLYQVVLTSPGACESVTSGTYTFNLYTPSYSATITSANTSFCSPTGAPVVLAAAPTGTTGASTYVWSTVPASSFTATGATLNATPGATTLYKVTGTDAAGCSASATINVVSSLAITATLTASASTVCPETPVTISATAIGGGPQVAPTGYPASNATSTSDEDILNVTFGSINNTSTCSTTGGSGSILNEYSDFTSLPAAIVSPGQTLPISISVGTCGGNFTNYTNVYIDYNRNGAFESNEQAFTEGTGVSGAHLVTGSITIPTNATAGVTRMRVYVVEFGSSTSSPSVTYSWGETEDYNINILTDVTSTTTYAWSSVPADATLATETGSSITRTVSENTTYTVSAVSAGGCATTASTTITTQSGAVIIAQPASAAVCQGATATFTVGATGPGLTYQWSKNGTAITGNASATTATLTLTGTTAADNGTYSVLVHPVCGDDAVSNGVATLTVNPLPTATISGTVTACTNETAPLVTFTGAAGTAPYTFTYSLNGAADQTIVSNGSGVATITAPLTLAGTFVYTLKSVVDSSSTACTQLQTGTATITVLGAPSAVTISPASSSVCSAGAPVLLTGNGGTLPSPTGYASSGSTSTADEEILNVTFGTLNNSSTCSTTGGGSSILNRYSDFTAVAAPVVAPGQTVPVSINVGTCGGNYTSFTNVYIDYNRNGVFESTERAFSSTAGVSGPHLVSGSITIPTTASSGITRMRVLNIEGGSTSSSPTGTYGYGETEDYNVNISGGNTYVWSSANGGLYTDAAGTVAYDGTTPRTTIYARPSATGTVTATKIGGGCSSSASTTVTVETSTTTEYSVIACGTYHWSINGSDYTASGDYTYVTGCHTDVLHLTISCTSVLNLKVAIQGYYDTVAHAMRPVMANQGVGTSTTNVDDIIVSLRDVTDYHVVASTTAKLQTNGDAVCTFSTAPNGTFYVSVAHRNSVQVMSATAVAVGPTPASFDFTAAAARAFGSNQVLVDGVYTMYSGDFNQDGFVDIFDYPAYDAANQSGGAFDGTYVVTDLNGDGFVDIFDYPIYDANNQGNVQAVLPYSLP